MQGIRWERRNIQRLKMIMVLPGHRAEENALEMLDCKNKSE